MMMNASSTTTTKTMLCFYLLILVVVVAATTTTLGAAAAPPRKPIKLQLYHHIDLENSSYESYYQSRLRSGPSRLAWMRSEKRRPKEEEEQKKNNNSSMYGHELEYTLPLGNPFQKGIYLFDASIGNPPTEYKFQIDTGNNVPWLQCEPCSNCYPQSAPIYNPFLNIAKDSKVVEYKDPLCQSLGRNRQEERGPHGECEYSVNYGDGSSTEGYLLTDRFTIGKPSGGGTLSKIIPIGCSVDTNGSFDPEQAGLMAFSRGPLSLVKTLQLETFSYCLVTPGNRITRSTLILNDPPPAGGTYSISLQTKEPLSNKFLYVNLVSIKVNDIAVDIPPGTFELQPDDPDTGVIFDSGSVLTYFTRAAYDPLREAFVRETQVPVKERQENYDLCFDRTNRGIQNPYPTLTYYFDQGIPMGLRPGAYIDIIEPTTDCFSILPYPVLGARDSVIGSNQQYGNRFHYDIVNNVVTVTERQC